MGSRDIETGTSTWELESWDWYFHAVRKFYFNKACNILISTKKVLAVVVQNMCFQYHFGDRDQKLGMGTWDRDQGQGGMKIGEQEL